MKNQLTKRKKIVLSTLGFVLLVGGGTSAYYYQDAQANEQAQLVADQKTDNKILTYQKEVDGLYVDKKQEKLQPELKKDDVSKLVKKIEAMKDVPSASLSTYEKVKDKAIMLLDMVIVRDGIQKITLTTTDDDVKAMKSALNALGDDKPQFVKEQMATLNNLKKQRDQALKAKKEVAALFTKSEVKSSVTRSAYDQATKSVNSVADKKLKKELNNQLEKVSSFLKKQEDKILAKQQKEAEAQEAITATNDQASPTATQEGTATNNAPSNNQGGTASNNGSSNNQGGTASNNGSSNNQGGTASNNGSSNNQGGTASNNGSSNNQGGTTSHKAPSNNQGGGSSSGNKKPSGNDHWEGNVEWTEGGKITAGGGDGGTGSNTWTGGEFDPGDIDW